MNIQSTQKVPLSSANRAPKPPEVQTEVYSGDTVVSAYIDGKSAHIEALKLDAVKRLKQAKSQSSDSLKVVLDGQRHNPKHDLLRFAALGLAPSVAMTGLGYQLAGVPGAVIGGVAGLAICILPSTFFLHRALKAPGWQTNSRWNLEQDSRPSPVNEPGAERLRSLVDQAHNSNPEARQILFLSGHGSRDNVADMDIPRMGKVMQGTQLDATIMDSCLTGQLETLVHMAPWAGFVMTSPHPIRARGLELPIILSSENLSKGDMKTAATAMAACAKSTTPSFAVVDTKTLTSDLLPKLDNLGTKLAELHRQGEDKALRRVLAKSLSTDGLLSKRVDLGSFLHQLQKAKLAPQETQAALESFLETVPFQKNEHSLSFHLKAGQSEESLPSGWREFLKETDRSYKPWF